jgi:hypothetical protein
MPVIGYALQRVVRNLVGKNVVIAFVVMGALSDYFYIHHQGGLSEEPVDERRRPEVHDDLPPPAA